MDNIEFSDRGVHRKPAPPRGWLPDSHGALTLTFAAACARKDAGSPARSPFSVISFVQAAVPSMALLLKLLDSAVSCTVMSLKRSVAACRPAWVSLYPVRLATCAKGAVRSVIRFGDRPYE